MVEESGVAVEIGATDAALGLGSSVGTTEAGTSLVAVASCAPAFALACEILELEQAEANRVPLRTTGRNAPRKPFQAISPIACFTSSLQRRRNIRTEVTGSQITKWSRVSR